MLFKMLSLTKDSPADWEYMIRNELIVYILLYFSYPIQPSLVYLLTVNIINIVVAKLFVVFGYDYDLILLNMLTVLLN